MSVYKTILFVCDWCSKSEAVTFEDKIGKRKSTFLPPGWGVSAVGDSVLCDSCSSVAGAIRTETDKTGDD